MKSVNVHDAKTNLSKYMVEARKGQKIFFGPRGLPEFEIVHHKHSERIVYRKLGGLKGKVWIGPDAFSRETDEEIAKMMYGD